MSGEVITPQDFEQIPEDLQGVFEETEEVPTHWVCNTHPGDQEKKISATFGLRPLPRPLN